MTEGLSSAAAVLADREPRPGRRPALPRILHAIRKHLKMDVAFISEITGGERVFRHIDADDPDLLTLGGSDPVEDSYCQRVLDGRLPGLMADACLNLEAVTLAATRQLPVGAHLSVPIRLADGRIYGTFCCFSHTPDHSLTERDLSMMRVFAEMAGEQIQEELLVEMARQDIQQRIDTIIDSESLQTVYQPIVELASQRIVAFEALTRFRTDPYRTPDLWFADAALAGRAIELEVQAIRKALAGLATLPQDVYLTVNASPETITHGGLAGVLDGLPLHRVVIEVTEHRAIERYEDIVAVIEPLKARGLRIAIDDAGAGYSSFRHILNLQPDIVKLDISITRAIDTDRSRRALAAALCGFASETGCRIVAEGVETDAELDVIRALGISKAQGYLLGRPVPLDEALKLLDGA